MRLAAREMDLMAAFFLNFYPGNRGVVDFFLIFAGRESLVAADRQAGKPIWEVSVGKRMFAALLLFAEAVFYVTPFLVFGPRSVEQAVTE